MAVVLDFDEQRAGGAMRHVVLVLVGVILSISMVMPASASAGKTWPVFNTSGQQVGSVERRSLESGPAYWVYGLNNDMLLAGAAEASPNLYYASNAGTAVAGFYVKRATSGIRWRILDFHRTELIGRVRRAGGCWVVESRDGDTFSREGWVDDSCTAWGAAAAVGWMVARFEYR